MIPKYDYSKVKLTPQQIEAEEYKNHLGGGAKNWYKRGALQVVLMKFFGLKPESSLLDVGCGPLRAGVHLIRFLSAGRYSGVDSNPSFLEAARRTLEQEGLSESAVLTLLDDFDFETLKSKFDFALCFSVLNHCDHPHRRMFFERVQEVMSDDSRLIVTHGEWFKPEQFPTSTVRLSRKIETEKDLGLKFGDWGFRDGGTGITTAAGGRGIPLPILEFTL